MKGRKRLAVHLHSHKMLYIFSFKKIKNKKKLLPTHHARPSAHFHLSGAHQTTSLHPAGNSCWCASISILIPICFQVPLLPMSTSLSISLGGTHISWASPCSSPCFVSPDTFLKVRHQQGCKNAGMWKRGMKSYLQLVNSPITTWRTNDTMVKSIGQVDSAMTIINGNRCVVAGRAWMNGWRGDSCMSMLWFDYARVCM